MRRLGFILFVFLGACASSSGSSSSTSASSSSGNSACPDDLPQSCPSPEPSYANDVAPAITRNCKVCHTKGGLNQDQLFDTYSQVQNQRIDILTQVNDCRMPPSDAGITMSEADRLSILGWLICGAKDN